MPEGHTVHRLARDHTKHLAGRPVRASSPQGRFAEGAARVDGRVPLRFEAYGKHELAHLDSGEVLHVHLGLIGKWRRVPVAEQSGIIRLRLATNGTAWDLSGPQSCELVTPDEKRAIVRALGPDPLRRGAEPGRLIARVRASHKAIGALLLEQDVVAGIGNVYRAEVLFLRGIHPARPGTSLDEDELHALWATIVDQLRAGVRRNRIVTVTAEDAPGPLSRLERPDAVYAYHREGLPCRRCSTPIVGATIGGRRTWWCPRCQS